MFSNVHRVRRETPPSGVRAALTPVIAASFLVIGMQSAANAGKPKLDPDTCSQLHVEQAKFIKDGIMQDLDRGADWGKTNLSAGRLREIQQYLLLEEQIKFGCREEVMTPEMLKAAEIAKRIELNSDADPFAPAKKPTAAKPAKPAASSKPAPAKPVAKDKPAAAPKLQKNSENRAAVRAAQTRGWSVEVRVKKLPAGMESGVESAPPAPPAAATRTADGVDAPPQF